MLDESLLFQMGFITPDITLFDVVVSLFFALLIFGWISRKHLFIRSPRVTLPPLPSVDDVHFEEKLARFLRAHLAHRYFPEHTSAHTAREIESYAKDSPLLPLLKRLETLEYTSKRWSKADRSDILDLVRKAK